jgi:hypothetical protein
MSSGSPPPPYSAVPPITPPILPAAPNSVAFICDGITPLALPARLRHECSICLDHHAGSPLLQVRNVSGCNHIFCFRCLFNCARSSNRCPRCRQRWFVIPPEELGREMQTVEFPPALINSRIYALGLHEQARVAAPRPPVIWRQQWSPIFARRHFPHLQQRTLPRMTRRVQREEMATIQHIRARHETMRRSLAELSRLLEDFNNARPTRDDASRYRAR